MEATSHSGHRGLRVLIGLLAALATSVVAAVLFASPASAAGQITASQTSGLTSGQTITVTGTGFSPNAALFLAFCDTSVPNGGACDTGHFKSVTTSASGGFTSPLTVEATFGTTNCASKPCGIQTSNSANPTNAADAATLLVHFGGAATTPPASSSSAAASLPAGVTAGKADTGSQLTAGTIGVGVAVLLIGGGLVLMRTRIARHRA